MATVTAPIALPKRPRLAIASAGRRRALWRAAIAAVSLVSAAAVLQSGSARWLRQSRPALAARIDPASGRAALDAALALVEAGAAPGDPSVQALVHRALRRDATMPAAIELTALARESSGDVPGAAKLYRLSDRISRRSLATRLWLVQQAVERGDVAATLQQMDVALRTSSAAPEVVFPSLARGLEDPHLVAPIARLVDRPSEWREAFLNYAIDDAQAEAAGALLMAMRDTSAATAGELDRKLIARLVDTGAFAMATRLDARYAPRERRGASLAFADPAPRYPFGWGLLDGSALGARRETAEGRSVLAYHARAAESGQVAAQLLTLDKGSYALETRFAHGDASRPRPTWVLTCAGHSRSLATLALPGTASEGASTAFTVPADCPAQWLVLTLRPSLAPQTGAIAGVSISRR